MNPFPARMKVSNLILPFLLCAGVAGAQNIKVGTGKAAANAPVQNRIATQLPAAPDLANAFFLVEKLDRTLPGGGTIRAFVYSINNLDKVMGINFTGGSTPVIWSTTGTHLAAVSDYFVDLNSAKKLNDFGQFVANKIGPSPQGGVFSFSDLDGIALERALPGKTVQAINSIGWLLATEPDQPRYSYYFNSYYGRHFILKGTTEENIGLPLDTENGANLEGINFLGEVVGGANPQFGNVGARGLFVGADGIFRWLPSNDWYDEAYALNESGQIVGTTGVQDLRYRHVVVPAYWENGRGAQIESLPTVRLADSFENGWANAINRWGHIVGYTRAGIGLWVNKRQIDFTGRLINPDNLRLINLKDINDNGVMLGEQNFSQGGNWYADNFILRPVWPQLAVDANRDGQIKFGTTGTIDTIDTSDVTSTAQPFRFWINDDIDRTETKYCVTMGSETEQDDKAGSGETDKNCNNIVIDCERDLEDLTQLWIYTQGLNTAFKNGDLQLGLKWTDVSSGIPAIRLFRAVETNGGTAYLSDEQTAHSQIDQTGQGYGMAIGGNGLVEGTTTYILPQAVFANLSDDQPKTYLLFEGVKAGKGQLKLVVLKPDGTEIGEGSGMWMQLDGITSFYERHTVGDDPSEVPATTATVKDFAYPAPIKDEEKDYILYVHGYNMPVWEKERWAETIYKRTWHLGYKGRVGIYEGPCTVPECVPDSLDVFDRSEFRAWQSAAGLRDLLTRLKSAAYRVRVIAHSQGNVVTSEALRQAGPNANLVHTYAACQGALAAHCFNPSAMLNMEFPSLRDDGTPNVYAQYQEPGMTAPSPYLTSSFMQGAAGSYVNFYNQRDYALSPTGGAFGSGSWQTDNQLKPNQSYGYNVIAGFFRSMPGGSFTSLRLPDDRYEIFSFGAEARSLAVGAAANVGGVFGSEIDLDSAPYNFGPEHVGHSAQFRSYAANRRAFWRQLLRAFNITIGQL